ncbi:DNA-directed RNA polymerase subunit beta [Bacillus sp. H-16]|uniref:DNA-directed RNA polymerase subunit beta n=1 Tax=Alteribacter salitolerans TaxID=2912333 RepID=UPI0019630FAC|nr:DNA-directed RNA polymerase subunit beta [Alteribacter salitolerans]MBM7095616.1 DNA-directed RNA polymerase subunit beta [Alteribacter salitolerans]
MTKENETHHMTREEIRKQKHEAQEQEKVRKKEENNSRKIPGRIRLIPIWLRLILVVIFLFISLAAGAMIGYGVVGDGNPADVFERDTWYHIVDIIYKDTDVPE